MNVQVKSSGGLALIPIESRLMANRKIFIEGEINKESAMEFVKKIMVLTNEVDTLPIDVIINSGGGEINSGLMMYDVLQSSVCPIRMFCVGGAYSMAAVLFASGKNGRYMLPHSELMLHEPLLGNRVEGNASSIRSISESLLAAKNKLNKILSLHTGKSESEIEQATSYDHFYSPEESIDFGLADEIVDFDFLFKNGGNL